MDGNQLHDLHDVEALLVDITARRVALTDFGDRAQVSTVLLVVDTNWLQSGPPLIFETMTFVDGHGDLSCERTSTRSAALAMHDQACAVVRDMLGRFDAEVAALSGQRDV